MHNSLRVKIFDEGNAYWCVRNEKNVLERKSIIILILNSVALTGYRDIGKNRMPLES